MKKLKWLKFVCMAMVALAICGPARADIRLLGTEKAGTSSTLVELDLDTGQVVDRIGDIGYKVNGLTYDPTTSTLFATTSSGSAVSPSSLITIDMDTGAGTLVGDTGDLVNLPTVTSAGELYAWTEDYDVLIQLDKATGERTYPAGTTEYLTSFGHGMAFDSSDTLWLFNGDSMAYTIDTSIGEATFEGYMPVEYAHHGDFNPETGIYYGITSEPWSDPQEREIGLIDTSDLSLVDTLQSDSTSLFTLAFVSGSGASPVPVPGAVVLAFLGLGTARARLRRHLV